MLTRIVKDGRAWVESTEGFRFESSLGGRDDGCITYTEGDCYLQLNAFFWHDSEEDRKADLSEMSLRQLGKYFERTVTLIYAPDVLQWHNSTEAISADDRARILANIQGACKLEGLRPRFVKD